MSLLQPPPTAIVIGASAGGVAAVRELLAGLPARLPCAVLVVIHLPRGRPSQLAEVMAGTAALPVLEAEDKQPIVAGQVLLAPADYHLMVEDAGHVALSVDTPPLYSMPSIDVPLINPIAQIAAMSLNPCDSGSTDAKRAGAPGPMPRRPTQSGKPPCPPSSPISCA